jgi:hypothetical protein
MIGVIAQLHAGPVLARRFLMMYFRLIRRIDGRWSCYGRTLSPQLALAWFHAGEDHLVEDCNHGLFDEEELGQLCVTACGV